MANLKTNPMRILEKAGVSYNTYQYDTGDGAIDGVSVAHKLGQPVEQVFKTLVTVGASKTYYVFVIPVSSELNLKAAARAVQEKSVEMIKVADINKVTGYIRGGCSPIGMKKAYVTVVDAACQTLDQIIVSAGKIGYQIELPPQMLVDLIGAKVESVTL